MCGHLASIVPGDVGGQAVGGHSAGEGGGGLGQGEDGEVIQVGLMADVELWVRRQN